MLNRYRVVARGLKTYLPGWSPPRPGNTDSGRYCYTVWLRHLALLREAGLDRVPTAIAELGPGESLGLGLAALLSGAERYVGLDIVPYAVTERNRRVFEELVELFRRREDLPGEEEFPRVYPRLASYRFADAFPDPAPLDAALSEARVRELRASLEAVGKPDGSGRIRYICPWYSGSVLEPESVDAVYSQAVLEHIDDLEGTYVGIHRWLKPGGFMSHQIDFKCHGMTPEWNGHWSFPDPVWRVIRGRHPYLLNRQVLSTHLRLMEQAGFTILKVVPVAGEGGLPRERLAPRYRDLSPEDLAASSAQVIAIKS